MGQCQDYPCCGHENGCCPSYDALGRQLDMVCICGARLPVTAPYSICHHCMKQKCDEEGVSDEEAMDEAWDCDDEAMDGEFDSAMESAGHGTDEDYGFYGDNYDYDDQ